MVQISSFFIASALATGISALPVNTFISQTISDSTTKWVAACQAAGGSDQCQTIAQTAFTTLLAAGSNCDQQNAADSMISLAKTLKNSTEMITLAQIFAQQPRNAPDSLQVPYCQTAPNNTELNGFFHCQFNSSDFTKFSGDQTGNTPLGLSAVDPAGSCPANPSGPVDDGVQLNTLVSSPGTPITSNANATSSGNATASASSANSTATAAASASSNSTAKATSAAAKSSSAAASSSTSAIAIARRASSVTISGSDTATATVATSSAASASASASATASDSSAANATSTSAATGTSSNSTSSATSAAASSSSTSTASSSNSTDTSATSAAATSTSTSSSSSNSTSTTTSSASSSSSTSTSSGNSTTGAGSLANGEAAQKLNKQFASIDASANSTCSTDGEVSCAGASFAECANGALVTTACGSGTSCFALPLTSGDGTTVACTTQTDAQDRITATGATGGVDGSS
ncbi:uncharacterized protein STEHIDRAFT_140294 [Stereum hirsutum FP-91666 SS1]|uniref:uncharacterized protein n=1 Tax=Stereum hirsutum (strain FP-91666) TaxID=721885 RepID=UPI0004449FF0|nr:uncharacterized protein STEHIDRAFT_140294 [Stereum hirsutum FP-91666 SS1]EIM84694.1 hypothetical protein STEHIDRAFT_140294 [Stereum hirsutum FP-91666 SS1]